MAKLSSKLRELQRRHVIRTGVAYVVGAWLAVQIANGILPVLGAPSWLLPAFITVLALGLPAALVFSWFFEVTASGVKRAEDVLPEDALPPLFDRRVGLVIIGMLSGGLLLSLYSNFRGPDAPPRSVSVLIADFENATGNDLFSGVLEESLRISLEVSPVLDSFSRNTAASIAASLPGADPDSESLDLETAGVVALREGVNIVIGGSVSRGDGGLTISVTGIAPGDGRELFAVTETAESDAEVLSVIAAIARDVRLELDDTEAPGGAGEYESFAVANLEAAAEYLTAQDLQRNRMLEEAAVHYERALEHDPDFARAYAGLALTESDLGRTEAAAEHWQEALSRLDRLTERGRLRTLGNYYYDYQRDYENALATYERLFERYPLDNVAPNNLAVSAFQLRDFGRALEVGREVVERFPDDSGYRANLALFAMYASNFDEASDVARRLIEDDPSSAYAFIVLALTHAVAGDFVAAGDAYERMAELDQFGRSVAPEGLADLAIYSGDMDTAIAILDDAIEDEFAQGANYTAALKQVMRAEALLRIDERENAQSAIDSALQYSAGDVAILVPGALALAELGQTDRAEAIAADLSTSLSKSEQAYADAIRAELAYLRGEPIIAIRLANAAIETADLWLLRFIRGNIYLQSGFTAEAAADLQVCQERIGEGIAVFLNDRPSLRLVRDLETAIASTSAGSTP